MECSARKSILMADDWYRRKTWTAEDREEFFTRLRRSRGAFHKAQYARIQAFELLTTRTRDAYVAALELLDLILTEWRDDAQLASVYHHRAECFIGLGDRLSALDAFRQVFQTQRVSRGELTAAHLDFGWLVATAPIPELYDEALAVLDEFGHEIFPVQRYRASAIRALIFDSLGQREQAQIHAHAALQETEATHSGFRYHACLGLVDLPDERTHNRLKTIA
jgi:tetratricopeptide (TPR) repeat protein